MIVALVTLTIYHEYYFNIQKLNSKYYGKILTGRLVLKSYITLLPCRIHQNFQTFRRSTKFSGDSGNDWRKSQRLRIDFLPTAHFLVIDGVSSLNRLSDKNPHCQTSFSIETALYEVNDIAGKMYLN